MERNFECKVCRAVLGDSPTHEEADAVVAYDLEQYRIDFLHCRRKKLTCSFVEGSSSQLPPGLQRK